MDKVVKIGDTTYLKQDKYEVILPVDWLLLKDGVVRKPLAGGEYRRLLQNGWEQVKVVPEGYQDYNELIKEFQKPNPRGRDFISFIEWLEKENYIIIKKGA